MEFWPKKALRKWRSYVLVVVGAYILALAFGTLFAPLRGNLENLVFDQYQRWRPRPYNFDQPVRIVDIDDESIRHCQSKFYTACWRTRARWSSTVFAHELPPRAAGFDAENRLFLFALTVPA